MGTEVIVDVSLMVEIVLGGSAIVLGALYLRLVTLLDDTSKRLQDVCISLANHGARIEGLERKQ